MQSSSYAPPPVRVDLLRLVTPIDGVRKRPMLSSPFAAFGKRELYMTRHAFDLADGRAAPPQGTVAERSHDQAPCRRIRDLWQGAQCMT